MQPSELAGVLDFLRAAEGLKTVERSGWTSAGRPESVAEHTWRLCLMALVLHPSFPGVDFARLVKICIVHDLGEVIGGDVPAPEQARRGVAKAADERQDLQRLLTPLSPPLRDEITALWDEYEAAESPEARLAKGLDKLETILQHTQGRNPADFDYRFNLAYGRRFTADPPLLAALREVLDAATEQRAREADAPTPTPAASGKETRVTTRANGTFEVKLAPQSMSITVDGPPLGRMSIDKQFRGDLEATSKGEMLAARTAIENSAGYVAIERVTGTLGGRRGTFVLQHSSTMTRGTPRQSIVVVPDSGTGELEGLTGTMTIIIEGGRHSYEFDYALPVG